MMYLHDPNVINELRKQGKVNVDVYQFFYNSIEQDEHLYISVITLGELR